MHRIQIKKLRDDDLRIFLASQRNKPLWEQKKEDYFILALRKKMRKNLFFVPTKQQRCVKTDNLMKRFLIFFFLENVRWKPSLF